MILQLTKHVKPKFEFWMKNSDDFHQKSTIYLTYYQKTLKLSTKKIAFEEKAYVN